MRHISTTAFWLGGPCSVISVLPFQALSPFAWESYMLQWQKGRCSLPTAYDYGSIRSAIDGYFKLVPSSLRCTVVVPPCSTVCSYHCCQSIRGHYSAPWRHSGSGIHPLQEVRGFHSGPKILMTPTKDATDLEGRIIIPVPVSTHMHVA